MTPANILLVEDEGIVSIDIRNILSRLGYSVTGVAFSGEEALTQIKTNRFDLVLMDIGLKGEIDGIEVANIIKNDHRTPIIFITGFADANTLNRANKTEPAGYIVKPINEVELEKTLKDALR